jgi:hypothetical protein
LSVVITTVVPAGDVNVMSRSAQPLCVMPVVRLRSHRYVPAPATTAVKVLGAGGRGRIGPVVPAKAVVVTALPQAVGTSSCEPLVETGAKLCEPLGWAAGMSPPKDLLSASSSCIAASIWLEVA